MLSENIKTAIMANVAAGIAMMFVGRIFDGAFKQSEDGNAITMSANGYDFVGRSSYTRKTACTQTLRAPMTTEEWSNYYQKRYGKTE